MQPLRTDLSVFSKFNAEYPPVGVKFLTLKPDGIEQLDKAMALCAMVKEAQQREKPFYMTAENENCSGKATLGMTGHSSPVGESGLVGMKFGIFQEPRANSKLNKQAPAFTPGVVNYIAFARFDQLNFDPDLLFFIGTPSQAEIVMRALSYSTGDFWESKLSLVGACAYTFTYPFQTGKINYVPTGMTFGMKARKVYPEGLILISIPYNWIPTIAENLRQMDWMLPSYSDTPEEFDARLNKIMAELAQDFQKP
jgi:uncharacterized protein (DUF169 family)